MRILHITTTDISLELLLGDQLSYFVREGFEVHAASAPGEYREAIEARGVTFHELAGSTRSWSLTGDLRATVSLAKLLRHVRPDILHTHNPKPGIYGRLVGRLTPGVTVMNTVHGLYVQPSDPLKRRIPAYALERVAAACSEAEFFQNSEDLDTYRRLRVPESRLHLIGNGIDLKRFRPALDEEERDHARELLGVRERSTVVFGCIARLVKEKGLPELVEAYAALKDQGLNVALVIIGGEDVAKADALTPTEIQDAKQSGVIFLGHRSDIDVLYRGIDVVVSASHREGFPRSVMEGSASGTSIIATDIRGTRDAVSHPGTAVFVRPTSPTALASAMAHLARNEAERTRLSSAAKRNAKDHFDCQLQGHRIADVYRRI